MDGNAALAPGNTHLLFAVGAFKITVILILDTGCQVLEFVPYRPHQLQKFGIFCPAAVCLPGQAAE